MSRLDRGGPAAPDAPENVGDARTALLGVEKNLGLGKIVARSFSEADDQALLKSLAITGDMKPHTALHGAVCVAWISPRERFLLGEPSAVADALRRAAAALSITSLALDVTPQYRCYRVSGPDARAVLSSLTPKDLHTNAFPVDRCVRTIFGECAVLVQRLPGAGDFRLVIDQSYAEYAWRLLCDARQNLAAGRRLPERSC